MDIIFQECKMDLQMKLMTELAKISLMKNSPQWSKPKPLFKKKHRKKVFESFGIPTGTIGVYRIIYKPTNETMSIGCGSIGSRLSRHRSVFLNKGKDISHKSGTTSGSATGGHMYKYDRKRSNWLFSWCDIGNKGLSEQYEVGLQEHEKPPFNKLSMAGK